jgi:hypothetical protein
MDSPFSFPWTPRFRAHRTVGRIRLRNPRIRMIGCIVRGAFGRERCWLREEHAKSSSRRKAVMLVQRDLTPSGETDREAHNRGRQHRRLCFCADDKTCSSPDRRTSTGTRWPCPQAPSTNRGPTTSSHATRHTPTRRANSRTPKARSICLKPTALYYKNSRARQEAAS